MASGKTLRLRYVRRPAPVKLHEHTATAGWDRRHFHVLPTRAVAHLHAVTRRNGRSREDERLPAVNVPYVNPDRDLKAGKRLRKELR